MGLGENAHVGWGENGGCVCVVNTLTLSVFIVSVGSGLTTPFPLNVNLIHRL